MKKVINEIADAIKANLVIVLILMGVGTAAAVVVSMEDNTARPSAEVEDAVWTEWQEMEPAARHIVCGMFDRIGNSDEFFQMLLTEGGVSEMEAKAKIAVMERECDRV